MVKRFLPVLFFLCAGAASSTLEAQTAGVGGDAITNEPSVMLVGNDDGSAMISTDGGNVWRLLDPVAAEHARRTLAAAGDQNEVVGSRRATAAPNPTSGATAIHYTAADAGAMTITLYSTAGGEVLRTTDHASGSGARVARLDASSVGSGTYLFRILNEAGRTVGEGNLIITR
jgi:hypothetical protein